LKNLRWKEVNSFVLGAIELINSKRINCGSLLEAWHCVSLWEGRRKGREEKEYVGIPGRHRAITDFPHTHLHPFFNTGFFLITKLERKTLAFPCS
jgi:hypothetical protein